MTSNATQPPEHYQIAIIGGGIAGLTLALACEKYGIRYALFETRDSLVPADGASIALQANGLRILEQLGVLKEIEQQTVPIKTWRNLDENGELLSKNEAFSYYHSKIGYGCICLNRHEMLSIMSSRLQGQQANNLIRLACRVSTFEEDENKITVTTGDGIAITADLLVGADGVRSSVRKFIDSLQVCDHAESDDYMTTRFACVYGISPPIDGIVEGDCFSVYREEATVLSFTGKGGVVFWFVFEDLGETFPLSKSPRYTAADADTVCQSVAHLRVAPAVLFGEIYANRTVCVKTALEEGIAQTWNSDRAVLMVPNAAMGGNQAIESVALLLNEIDEALKGSDGKITGGVLKAALSRYSEQRKARTSKIQKMAGKICRTQMLLHEKGVSGAIQELPNLTDADWLFRGFMGFVGAPALNGISLTERGKLYDAALESFELRFATKQFSNAELFGLS